MDRTFLKDWRYRHGDNPYHDKLASFGNAVLRDGEAEEFAGRWGSDVFQRPPCPSLPGDREWLWPLYERILYRQSGYQFCRIGLSF